MTKASTTDMPRTATPGNFDGAAKDTGRTDEYPGKSFNEHSKFVDSEYKLINDTKSRWGQLLDFEGGN